MKYYSEILNDKFDTEEQLKEAEAAYNKKQEEKELAAKERKEEAKVVEDAYKALVSAKKVYSAKRIEISKEYAEEVKAAKKQAEEKLKIFDVAISDADKEYNEKLSKFIEKYGSYHMSLTDEDGTHEVSVRRNFPIFKTDSFFEDVWNLILKDF